MVPLARPPLDLIELDGHCLVRPDENSGAFQCDLRPNPTQAVGVVHVIRPTREEAVYLTQRGYLSEDPDLELLLVGVRMVMQVHVGLGPYVAGWR